MPETLRQANSAAAPIGTAMAQESHGVDPAQMWENLRLAEELLEDCEALAASLAARTVAPVPVDRQEPA